MKIFLSYVLAVIVAVLMLSCSEKRSATEAAEEKSSEQAKAKSLREHDADEEENETQPEAPDVVEDCIAFLRLTKAGPNDAGAGQCPTCPASDSGVEVLTVRDVKVNKIECAGESCEVDATLRVVFNESHGGEIRGGLTGWITPGQKEEYAKGKTPAGEQIYKLKINYRHDEIGWKAVEFEKG